MKTNKQLPLRIGVGIILLNNKNQVLMTLVIASFWIIPGILFTLATNRKYKNRQIERQIKKVARLYPQQ